MMNNMTLNNIKRIIREELEDKESIDPFEWAEGISHSWDEGSLRDILKQEGEIYVIPFRETSSKVFSNYDEEKGGVYIYTRRGEPVVYYVTDKIPEVLTPDESMFAEPDSTWTWGVGDLTMGDVFDRKHGEDRPLPHNLSMALSSLNHTSGRSDMYFVVDKNGNPMWDLVPNKYLKDLKKEYEKFK